jgi:hydroxymethylpyrimidine/phosphomethylpyrimidine kinase
MAETAKTTKARATAGTTKTTATRKTKKTVAEQVTAMTPNREEIARLAEQFWAERGWQDGMAEQDWIRAEQTLMAS